MTKRKSKSRKSTIKATAAKGAVKRSSTAPAAAATPPLIVLGFDDQQKPRGARFVDAKPDLVTKAADLMGFRVYQASLPDVAEVAKKLPMGRLYANGRGFVPNIRQSLYSDVIVELAIKPEALVSNSDAKDILPPARGLPRSWDEIGPGHLVIAQESLDYGWWEAVVRYRQGDSFWLRYRDYPPLPRFVRHQSAIAMMYPADDEQSSDEITSGNLVLAHESPADGWWEAIVIDRKADTFTLRYRDYPDLPKFVRHRSAIALMYAPTDEAKPTAQREQA